MVEQLLEQPIILVVIGVIILVAVGQLVWRWRRESAVRDHATEQGWRAVDDTETFADVVLQGFPELRDEAEQDARATHGKRGPARGPGMTLRVGTSPSVRSRVRARNVYLVPVEDGELAVGDISVSGQAGRLSQSRAGIHRGAVVAKLTDGLPPVRLVRRTWVDRDSAGNLPHELAERFNEEDLDDGARAVYLDSDAWKPVLEASSEVDGVVVDGTTAVLLCGQRLTPERASILIDAAKRFLGRATSAAAGGRDEKPASLTDPLGVR